jgi:hypothetical protein
MVHRERLARQFFPGPGFVLALAFSLVLNAPAEIRMYRAMGGDIVTHNVGTEAIYARQLGIHFAVVNSISNPAEGVCPFTIQEELASRQAISKGAVPIVLEAIVATKRNPECGITCTGEKY